VKVEEQLGSARAPIVAQGDDLVDLLNVDDFDDVGGQAPELIYMLR
jgi:hypothetical protein